MYTRRALIVGDGIRARRNAIRVLDHLAVAETCEGTACAARGNDRRCRRRPAAQHGRTAELVAIHRADLHNALLTGLSAEVCLDTTVQQ